MEAGEKEVRRQKGARAGGQLETFKIAEIEEVFLMKEVSSFF